MAHTKRESKCIFCQKVVEPPSPQVMTKSVRTTPGGKTYTRVGHYHVQCWVDQGMIYLEKHPAVRNFGRPRLSLSVEDRQKRLRILRRYSSLMYRSRTLMDRKDIVGACELIAEAVSLTAEIEKVGGIPSSWTK